MVQCVYKISCVDENIKEFYIGSTDNLKQRIAQHKYRYNAGHNFKVYKFIRENGGLSNWDINPIEIFSFLTEEELKQHEQFYMDEYKPQLNSNRAIGQNIDNYKKLQKIYYEDHKIKTLVNVKQYQQKNIEKVIKWKQKSYAKHAEKYAEKRKKKQIVPIVIKKC